MATKPQRKGSASSATGVRADIAALARIVDSIAANGGDDTYFAETEVEQWPSTLHKALDKLPLVAAASPATTVVCPGCEQSCVMPVLIDPPFQGYPARSSIGCDVREDIGIVDVPLAMLTRRKSNGQLLAQTLAVLLQPDAQAIALSDTLWRIGRVAGTAHSSAVELSMAGRAQLVVAGHTVDLQGLLTLNAGALALDMPRLRRLANSPTGTHAGPEESAQGRADRLRRRIAELKGQGVSDFRAQVAREEGVDKSRITQILAAHPEKKTVASPFPTTTEPAGPPHKKRPR